MKKIKDIIDAIEDVQYAILKSTRRIEEWRSDVDTALCRIEDEMKDIEDESEKLTQLTNDIRDIEDYICELKDE